MLLAGKRKREDDDAAVITSPTASTFWDTLASMVKLDQRAEYSKASTYY
jgi:hypothetical protein